MTKTRTKKAKQKEDADELSESNPALAGSGKSLVFISHDSRDADLAEAFANLLSDVSAGTLKSFRSSDKKGTTGIEFGTEWYKAIMSQLGGATDVVALLTQRSLHRPWILYEAGVAKGRLDTTVLGLALGVPLEKVSTGPFGQFHNCGDDEDSLTKLVMQLLHRNPEAAPREEAVRRQVQAFRVSVEKLLKGGGSHAAHAAPAEETTAAKLFEEVKAMVQALPDRVDDRIRSATRRDGHKSRRMHLVTLKDLLHHPAFRENKHGLSDGWLVLISFFRQDLPWIYDLGIELYRASRSNNVKLFTESVRSLQRVTDGLERSHVLYDLVGPESEEQAYLLRELLHQLRRELRRLADRSRQAEKSTASEESGTSELQ